MLLSETFILRHSLLKIHQVIILEVGLEFEGISSNSLKHSMVHLKMPSGMLWFQLRYHGETEELFSYAAVTQW